MRVRSAFKRIALVAALGVVFAFCQPQQAKAQFVCANCSTWVEQMLQYAQEVQTQISAAQTQLNTAIMLKNQITNMVQLPQHVWATLTNDIHSVQNLMSRGSQIALNAGMVSSQLASFNGFLGQTINYGQLYDRWSTQSNDAVTATMAGMGLQRDQMSSDQAVLAAIQAHSAGAVGMTQVLQANVEMNGQAVVELQKLRQLIMADAQMNANAQQIQADRRAAGEADWTNFMSTSAPSTSGNPRY